MVFHSTRMVAVAVLFLILLLVTFSPRGRPEGFQDLLATGMEVALWFPLHAFLCTDATKSVRMSERFVYPEEIPMGKAEYLWVLESERDPPGMEARFQLFPQTDAVRIRSSALQKYLAWNESGASILVEAAELQGDRGLWTWERRFQVGGSSSETTGLQWGDRIVLRPKGTSKTLVLKDGRPVVATQVAMGSEEILLVDRWGRGAEKEQARFGRARSSAGADNREAYLAIDGRDDSYCRLLPTATSKTTWWDLTLPLGTTWVERLALTFPESQPAMAPAVTVRLYADGAAAPLLERTWEVSQLPRTTTATSSVRQLLWDDLGTTVHRMRVEGTGPLYISNVKVFGTNKPGAALGEEPILPSSLALVPEGRGAAVGQDTLPPIAAAEMPLFRHYVSVFQWLRVNSRGVGQTLLWEWQRKGNLPGWRVWVNPLESKIQWQVMDDQGGVVQQLQVQHEALVGQDVHWGFLLRAPVSEARGWLQVPGVCVVHPVYRILYRWDGQSPQVRLPRYPNTASKLGQMADLGPFRSSHLEIGLEITMNGKVMTEAIVQGGAARQGALLPTGSWSLLAPVGDKPTPWAYLRAVRATNADPTSDLWSSLLRDAANSVRDLPRYPVMASEMPSTDSEWFLGTWIYPRRRTVGGSKRILWQGASKEARGVWEWTRGRDREGFGVFQWLNLEFPLPLEEWSWVVLSYAPMKPRIFVQGRMIRSDTLAQQQPWVGGLHADPVAGEMTLVGSRYGNQGVDKEAAAWSLRSAHPEAAQLAKIEEVWQKVGCPGRWDMEREGTRTVRWLSVLKNRGAEFLLQQVQEMYQRAQRYLRQESPAAEMTEDRNSLEMCYYPIPTQVFEEHRKYVQDRTQTRLATAPKCLPDVTPPG